MLSDDPNQSSAVYLLTSDDKYTDWGTNFSPNQLLCRKYLPTFLLCGGDLRSRAGQRKRIKFHRYADIGRPLENRGKELNNV